VEGDVMANPENEERKTKTKTKNERRKMRAGKALARCILADQGVFPASETVRRKPGQ